MSREIWNTFTYMKKVHLVLGSGGARGIAHIGVIDVLEETGHQIISITGCSMGAVVGGMYAAGYHTAYKEWMLKLTKTLLFKILDFTLTRQGFLKGERLFTLLQKVTGHQLIEQLAIPFVAVATDMVQNKEVYYTSGDLYKALRASIAIPGVFTPVLENGQFLVDGGVLNPLPLNLVHKKEDEYIVAVNVNGAASPAMTTSEEKQEVTALWKWLNPLMQKTNKPKELLPISEYSLRELLLSTYNMTQDRLTSFVLKTYPPDVLIEIPRNSCSTFEFYKAQFMIDLGRSACIKAVLQDQKPCDRNGLAEQSAV
jgi:NTE family protein